MKFVEKRLVFLEKSWLKAILGFWIVLISFSVINDISKDYVPVENWYEIRSVYVADADYPNSPSMVIDRTIHEAVRGNWIVTVMKQREDSDQFFLHCTAVGTADYTPKNVLPLTVDLDWWTWPLKCELPVGTYYISTLHIFHPEGYPFKESRISSNIFNIH